MARPILLELPPRDPRAELQSQLAEVPVEHAEALLAAYGVLQGLHDRGVLEFARGALGSGDRIVEILVAEAKSPEMIRALRNFLILSKMFGSIDSDKLSAITQTIEGTLLKTQESPPSLWSMLKRLWNPDLRRGLATGQSFLEEIGKALSGKPPVKKD